METTTEKNGAKDALSPEEKIEIMKAMFSTIPVDKKAEFTQWCHEEVEKGAGELLGEKMQKMNEQMNEFIANASDRILKTGEKIYNKTNEKFAFLFKNDEEIDNKEEEEDEGPSFFN